MAFGGITVVGPGGARRRAAASDIAHYAEVAILMDADQLANPVRYWFRGAVRRLTREADYRSYPLVGRDALVLWNRYLVWKASDAPPPAMAGTVSSIPDDFIYPVDQTLILRQKSGDREDAFDVALVAEDARTFGTFLVREGKGPWTKSPARFRWLLKPGWNRLSCRIRTSFGWLGPESHMTMLYWPSML
jgi:hypothetical protein